MAVNIYDELAAVAGRVERIEQGVAPRLRVAPVTYFRPGPLWDQALALKPALSLINPGSGPGPVIDAAYPSQVAKSKSSGVPVFGYVHTRYAARPISEVKADVDKHRAWYAINGIFVDTVSNKIADIAYYDDLCTYIHHRGLKTVLNPGTGTLEQHAQIADYVMVAETDYLSYVTQSRPAWEAWYPGKLWHCVHTCSAADMPKVVALAKSRGAGLLYVTNDVMANPYDTLPSYWTALCTEVAR